ncbi:MAG: protein-L-isoaspartate(D-aspartate) O-methyltransferase [Planctomycetaceae bacterium]
MSRNLTAERRDMVETQLRSRGLVDERVLRVMAEIPREEFVCSDDRDVAYADGAFPIGYGQTISQPYTVACMCEAANLQPGDRVLDVGTGSGYGAAVLSRLAGVVHSVEYIPKLARAAAQRLQRLGYANVTVHVGDGSCGWPEQAPFDVIVVAAAAPQLPQDYVEQLAEGGRIVIPIGSRRRGQELMRYLRNGPEIVAENLGSFSFVPLVGEHGA